MSKLLFLWFVAIASNAVANEEIFQCYANGKKIYQNFPCDEKEPKEKKKKTENAYVEAVDCGLKGGLIRLIDKDAKIRRCK